MPQAWKIHLRTASHHVTVLLATRFPNTFPMTIVTGFPKSGTTWVCQLAADYLQLPFPRYSLLPVGCPAVIHGHMPVRRNLPRGLYVVRDVRDALVSRYFFLLRLVPDIPHPPLPRRLRRFFPNLVDKADIRANLPAYLEAEFRRPLMRPGWPDHVRSFFDTAHPHFALVRYEDLLADGAATLASAISRITGAEPDLEAAELALRKFAFQRQVRTRGGNRPDAFLRRGQAGDWRRHFTPEAARIVQHYCGDMLIAAGYESDDSWVNRLDPVEVAPPDQQPSAVSTEDRR